MGKEFKSKWFPRKEKMADRLVIGLSRGGSMIKLNFF